MKTSAISRKSPCSFRCSRHWCAAIFESAGGFLTAAERQYIAFSGKLITFEIGIRFLADHLAGDTYFKVHREGHNLDRCRTQFKLVESIEMQEEKMNRLVESLG